MKYKTDRKQETDFKLDSAVRTWKVLTETSEDYEKKWDTFSSAVLRENVFPLIIWSR